jgi:hypothetical protein
MRGGTILQVQCGSAGGCVPSLEGHHRTAPHPAQEGSCSSGPSCTSPSLQAGRRALAEANLRGWSLFLIGGKPMLLAPVASLSPGLIDRLLEFHTSLFNLLRETLP